MRRGRTLPLLLVLVVAVTGCAGGGGGGSEDPIVAEASPATVGADALSETGYERVRATSETRNTSFTLSIQGDVEAQPTFEVTATVHRAVYRRSTSEGPATVALLSVPTVKPSEALASRVNPLGDRSAAELATNATGDAVSDLRHRENRTVTMLGNETTLRLFDGTVTREVEEMAAAVSVATVRDGTDEITFVAIYPRSVDDGASVERLLDGIEH